MVATSQPLATEAGLRMLRQGGNAVDAAVAMAAVLAVTEPMATGVGGDLFALVWRDGVVDALDAAGAAPAGAAPGEPPDPQGPGSVTVPGAVGGWAALLERHGSRGLDGCLADAIEVAERGFPLGANSARIWGEAPRVPDGLPRAPGAGEQIRLPELARTLREIARDGPDVVYRGRVAEAIAAATWLEPSDLDAYAPRWVAPLSGRYRDVEVFETPPPTQGIAALEGLALLELLEGGLRDQVTAVRLSLQDAFEHVRDGADVLGLLDPGHLKRRLAEPARAAPGIPGGTSHLVTLDENGTAVSLTQSVYGPFGSGLLAPGTGVVLNNRAACFSVIGGVEPGRRPYHTTIAGILARDGELVGPFGIMGGFIQAQAHVQFVSAVVDDGLDPQQALDRPRFRFGGEDVLLEEGLWDEAATVAAMGLRPVRSREVTPFGGGQAILRAGGRLLGGSDRRKDGCAAGL